MHVMSGKYLHTPNVRTDPLEQPPRCLDKSIGYFDI